MVLHWQLNLHFNTRCRAFCSSKTLAQGWLTTAQPTKTSYLLHRVTSLARWRWITTPRTAPSTCTTSPTTGKRHRWVLLNFNITFLYLCIRLNVCSTATTLQELERRIILRLYFGGVKLLFSFPSQPSYSNPLVAVKFLNITRNVEVKIVCKIIGAGITFDNVHDPYEGKVEFKLKIEDWAATETLLRNICKEWTYLLSHSPVFIFYDLHINLHKLQCKRDIFCWKMTLIAKNQDTTCSVWRRMISMYIASYSLGMVFCCLHANICTKQAFC